MKISKSYRAFTILNTLFLSLLTLLMLYPILHVIFASFSNGDELLAHRGVLLRPIDFNLDAYKRVFSNRQIINGYKNTLFILVVGLFFNMVLTSFGAYFTSRKYLYTRNGVMLFMIITMYFSGGTVPFYFVVRNLGLYDSLWSVILPVSVNTYNLIILRTAFAAVPDSLEEAAIIDGAGYFRILWQVTVPLSKATLAVVALYYMVGHWNSWFHASLFIKNRDLHPLQLVLREILIANDNSSMTSSVSLDNVQSVGEAVKYAVIVVSILPIMCVYPFLQKYFAKGVMIGAVKG